MEEQAPVPADQSSRSWLTNLARATKTFLLFTIVISLTCALTFLTTRYYDHRYELARQQQMISDLKDSCHKVEERLDKIAEVVDNHAQGIYEAVPVENGVGEVQDEKPRRK